MQCYQRYNPLVARDAVKYILGDRNIKVLSWGTRKVCINGEEVILPKLARKKCISNMIKEYHLEYDNRSERIGDTAFRSIARAITSHDTKAKTSVDYVAGTLLYDNIAYIKQVAHSTIDPATKVLAMECAKLVEACIKKYIPEHIRKSPCAQVHINYALDTPVPPTTDTDLRPCKTCLMPFQIIDRMKKVVDTGHVGMLNDCMLKIKLSIAHSLRSQNQNRRCDEVKNDLSNHQALIIMDFKMNANQCFTEKNQHNFMGKKVCRGMAH